MDDFGDNFGVSDGNLSIEDLDIFFSGLES